MDGEPANYPLQTKFWKSFGRYGIFLGTVVGYADDGAYRCYYEGDGDEENLTEEEIESWLKRYPSVAKMNQGAAKEKRIEDQCNMEGARKFTRENNNGKGPPKAVLAKRDHKKMEKVWKENLQKLKAFQEAHGHTRVPKLWPHDPKLGRWVCKQREKYKEGKLKQHRQTLLEEVGFEFYPQISKEGYEKIFTENLQKLKAFREAHGHARVPLGWPQDPSLGNWVKWQRQIYKEGRIQPHRQALLEQEGFEFLPQESSWGKNYQLLVYHKKKFGGFSNITTEGPHKKLSNWIKYQKREYREGHLSADRKKLLDEMGLDFQNQRATESTRAAKQRARLKIENQMESASDSYDSDESSISENTIASTHDETALSLDDGAPSDEIGDGNQQDRPEEVISSQAEYRCSGSEVAPDQANSSMLPAPSAGAATCGRRASRVAPDVACSATMPTVPRSASPCRARSKAAAQAVPDGSRSEPNGEPVVPDTSESRSTHAPSARTSPGRRYQKKVQQEKLEPNQKKPRWLFD